MPGKSGRKLSRSRRRKSRHDAQAITTQRQPVSQTYTPAPQPKVSAPPASIPTRTATLTAAQHPYIVPELRRIGILAGITLAILVVLVIILS